MHFSWKITILVYIALINTHLYNSITSTLIPKESFNEVLYTIPNSQTMPFVGIKWLSENYPRAFGGSSIEKELFNFIRAVLPPGKTILELGSGWASGQFSQYYTLYSVEHSKMWLNKYDSNYIYAPIKDKWYDADVLKKLLPTQYDLILVDGPPGFGRTNRLGFYDNLDLFKTDIPIIFDDVNRKDEYSLMIRVAQKLQRDVAVFIGHKKKFGIVLLKLKNLAT